MINNKSPILTVTASIALFYCFVLVHLARPVDSSSAGNGTMAHRTSAKTETISSRYTGAPVLADIDNNGSIEIIIGDLEGEQMRVFDVALSPILTISVESGIRATVAVDNLDVDSQAEFVFGTLDGYLHAYNHDGSAKAGYPILVATEGILSTPVLADIDGDTEPEIIFIAANGRVYVYEADGTPKWNRTLGDFAGVSGQIRNGDAVVADIDGDLDLEIIAGSYKGSLFAFSHTGERLWSFDTEWPIIGTPLVIDIDPETAGVESVFGSTNNKLYVISNTGAKIWERDTGASIEASPIIYDLDGDTFAEIIVGNNNGDLKAFHDWGDEVSLTGWPLSATDAISAPPFWQMPTTMDSMISWSPVKMAWFMRGTSTVASSAAGLTLLPLQLSIQLLSPISMQMQKLKLLRPILGETFIFGG